MPSTLVFGILGLNECKKFLRTLQESRHTNSINGMSDNGKCVKHYFQISKKSKHTFLSAFSTTSKKIKAPSLLCNNI